MGIIRNHLESFSQLAQMVVINCALESMRIMDSGDFFCSKKDGDMKKCENLP